jgi:hypothetical protein
MEDKNEIDWSILKGPLIIFSVCLIIASALIGGSYLFNKKLNNEFIKNKRIFQSISRKYLDVDQEEKLLREYYPQFVKLYNQGVIGREKRLNWIETLRQSGEKVKLPKVNYSIKSQETHMPEYNINYSGYALYRSSMDISLGLLHEGDLFNFLEYINNSVEGTYTISKCEFNMGSSKVIFEKDAANVNASCLLYWITIDMPGNKKIEIG